MYSAGLKRSSVQASKDDSLHAHTWPISSPTRPNPQMMTWPLMPDISPSLGCSQLPNVGMPGSNAIEGKKMGPQEDQPSYAGSLGSQVQECRHQHI